MYTEFNGRQWSSEDVYQQYKLNVRKNLKASLALEDYSDKTGDEKVYNEEAFKMLKEYRKNQNQMSEQQLLETSALIVQKFDALFNKIGKEKFIFYDDGDINYIWDNN